jgi:hypothetical protein
MKNVDEETRKNTSKFMYKLVGIFALFAVIVFAVGMWSLSSSSAEADCQVNCKDDEHPVDALIRKVKENDVNCGKYFINFPNVDKYGKAFWEERGYYVLSNDEWEELRKFENAHYYFEVYDNQPTFHSTK